jgi:hypothetical protein
MTAVSRSLTGRVERTLDWGSCVRVGLHGLMLRCCLWTRHMVQWVVGIGDMVVTDRHTCRFVLYGSGIKSKGRDRRDCFWAVHTHTERVESNF